MLLCYNQYISIWFTVALLYSEHQMLLWYDSFIDCCSLLFSFKLLFCYHSWINCHKLMVCICYASCIECDQIYNSLSHLARINSYITVDLLCFFYSGKPLVLNDSLPICSFPLVFLSLSTLTLCTLQLSGRWYLFMDTRNNIIRDNTYGDFEIASNGKLMISLYRYFP